MGKKYVLDGAMLQCNQGMKPAKLLVTENKKVKIQGKLQATDMDVQVPETFGQCKLKPTPGGYAPCVPALQKWTKTAQKSTLGGSKKFLFEDSECMCSTGGKVTVMQHGQINAMGSAKEEFRTIAQAMPGAMPGNDRAPKVVESYWMDQEGEKKISEACYGDTVQLFVQTEHAKAGQQISVKVKAKNKKKIDGKSNTRKYAGRVRQDGTALLQPLKTQENWNKTA